MVLCFPWLLSYLSGVLIRGSVLEHLRLRVGLVDSKGEGNNESEGEVEELTLRMLGISLLFGIPSVFPCSISALSSANVKM